MTAYYNRYPCKRDLHRQFAGEILGSDFCTSSAPGNVAARTAAARHFNNRCRQNYEDREREEESHQ